MRTIKFRGKRLDNGEWLYGNLVELRNPFNSNDAPACFIMPKEVNIAAPDSIAEQEVVIPDSVGQFTGLLDKNGKEIYEGDVLQRIPNEQYSDATGIPLDMLREDIGEGGDLVFVRYDESQSSVMYLSLSRKFNVHWLNTQYFTIIGNIHDNPELMKKND